MLIYCIFKQRIFERYQKLKNFTVGETKFFTFQAYSILECQKTTQGFEFSEPIREHAHKTISTVNLMGLEISEPIREHAHKTISTVYLMGLEFSKPIREHAHKTISTVYLLVRWGLKFPNPPDKMHKRPILQYIHLTIIREKIIGLS